MTTFKYEEFDITYRVSPPISNAELNLLFAAAWRNDNFAETDKDDELTDFAPVLERSLAFVCAYHSTELIGFVNLAWDGGQHAFILDTAVHPDFQRRGIGIQLVKQAIAVAKESNVEWLHVDFEPHLREFYDKCGFRDTNAGLINLKRAGGVN